jgi:hypothetical protein
MSGLGQKLKRRSGASTPEKGHKQKSRDRRPTAIPADHDPVSMLAHYCS